jgi:hypothetical protein
VKPIEPPKIATDKKRLLDSPINWKLSVKTKSVADKKRLFALLMN